MGRARDEQRQDTKEHSKYDSNSTWHIADSWTGLGWTGQDSFHPHRPKTATFSAFNNRRPLDWSLMTAPFWKSIGRVKREKERQSEKQRDSQEKATK